MLEAIGVHKRYGEREALRGIDLAIRPGEIYCLLGANGAGKTTTINLFLNFIEPTSGQLRVGGIDVAQSPLETKKLLAYIPEQVMLYPHLTGLENLEYFAALGSERRRTSTALHGFLARVGLPSEAADRRVGTYSKGMRQKVGVAIALAKEARAFLLDEPTSGLDPKASSEFHQLLVSLRDEGAAILMATHDLFRAKETGTRVGIMREGRLVQQLTAEEVSHSDLERIYLEQMS